MGAYTSVKPPFDAVIYGLAAEDQVLLTKLLTEPTDYVDHPDFATAGVERTLFIDNAKLTRALATRFRESADPISTAVTAGERVPTLSYAQEKHLFMRYNYARMQAALILRKHAGKVCVCELVPLFDIAQPTLSHHLKKLREAGIVDSERQGLWAYYYVRPDALQELTTWLS